MLRPNYQVNLFITQIIVSEDGCCGMNYEHSVAEGIALVQLVQHALDYV